MILSMYMLSPFVVTGILHKSKQLLITVNITALECDRCSSNRMPWSQIAFLITLVAAMYSASVVEKATTGWSLDFYEMQLHQQQRNKV